MTMETLSLIFACATIITAILYIRRIKIQFNNVEKAFKEACIEINKLKENQIQEIKFTVSEKDLVDVTKRILTAK